MQVTSGFGIIATGLTCWIIFEELVLEWNSVGVRLSDERYVEKVLPVGQRLQPEARTDE